MRVQAGDRICKLGLIGSARFDYSYCMPTMKYLRNLIQELSE
jgi:hypothetical protein